MNNQSKPSECKCERLDCKECRKRLDDFADEVLGGIKKPLTNLDKIKAAWDMGWSPVINWEGDKWGDRHVVNIWQDEILATNEFGSTRITKGDDGNTKIEEYKITGYKYAGELAGNTIPEGQKFRVKDTGEIGEKTSWTGLDYAIELQLAIEPKTFPKNEIEPYFE